MIFIKDAQKQEFALYVHGDGYPEGEGIGTPIKRMIYCGRLLDECTPEEEKRGYVPAEYRFLSGSPNINTDAGRFGAATAAILLNKGFHVYLEKPENLHGDIAYYYRITLPKKHEDVAKIIVKDSSGKSIDIFKIKEDE